jgi:pimeloyl-ACP methyl ester carboxylesterase
MIHGLGGTSNTFQPLMGRLGDFMVLRPDLPGCGRSATPDEELTISDMADSLLTLLKAQGLNRVHLVGHSMGTLICQRMAITAHECIASLTLIGALTEPPQAARTGLLARAATARSQGMQGIADQIISTALAPRTLSEKAAVVAFVRESLMRQYPEGYAKCCEALSAAQLQDVRKISAPTLLLTGDCDPVAPVSMAQQLCDALPHASLSVLADCGHWATLEQPQACASALESFIRRHPI